MPHAARRRPAVMPWLLAAAALATATTPCAHARDPRDPEIRRFVSVSTSDGSAPPVPAHAFVAVGVETPKGSAAAYTALGEVTFPEGRTGLGPISGDVVRGVLKDPWTLAPGKFTIEIDEARCREMHELLERWAARAKSEPAPDDSIAFLREVVAKLGLEAPAGDAATTAQGFIRAFAEERAAAAAKAAAEDRSRRVAAAVAELASPDPHKVFSACVVLGKLGDLSAVRPLVGALANKDAYARTGALTALASLHACDAVPAVLATVADKEEDVSQQAAAAFEKITGQRLRLPTAATKKQKATAIAQGTAWWKEHEAEVRTKWGQPASAAAPGAEPGKATDRVPATGRK